MIMPAARNSVDADLPAWSNGSHPETGLIEPYNCGCTNGSSTCNNGQSCFWFSQGCTIGCKTCDGKGQRYPNYDHCPGESIKPTLLPKYRTANQLAEEGSEQDIFKFNPWRAPGQAPVFDACGMAGGNYVEVFNAGAYNATVNAKQGDLGSQVLKPRPTGAKWKRGTVAQTRWQITALHGGGYQFRLCPLSSFSTDGIANEDCFRKMPLEFATPDQHMIRFKDSSKDHSIKATVVTEGGGKGWMKIPIPNFTQINCDYKVKNGTHCPWKCARCGAPWYAADDACPSECDKQYPGLPANAGADKTVTPDPLPGVGYHAYAIEDNVRVPADADAGDYVLQWRWDCESTSQVWTTCADITLE